MKPTLIAIAFIGAAAGAPTAAHHSYALYDREQIIEINGLLEEVEWQNPHTLLKVRTDSKLYIAEWHAATSLAGRHGITRETLRAGDHLVVRGNPRRDIDESGILLLQAVRRTTDGWSWGHHAIVNPSGSNR